MNKQIEELRDKKRKLTYILGEKIQELSRSQELRFLYTSDGVDKEEEVNKLLRLLDYLDERIVKLEDYYGLEAPVSEAYPEEEENEEDENEEDTSAEEKESGKSEAMVEESSENGSLTVEEEPSEAAAIEENIEEKKDEPLAVFNAQEENTEAESSVEETVVSESLPVAAAEAILKEVVESSKDDAIVALSEKTSSIEDPTLISEGCEMKETAASVEEKPIVEEAQAEEEAEAVFVSDAEKRIYERNMSQLQYGSDREREISVNQLSLVKDKKVRRKAYKTAMKDAFWEVRLAVIKQLARLKDDGCDDILALGLSDADERVKLAAVKAVATQVNDSHFSMLKSMLNDSDSRVRGLAVTYLGIYYGHEGARQAFSAVSDEDPYVRKSLLEMMAIVKPRGAMTIVKTLLSDNDKDVRKASEDALSKMVSDEKKGKSYVSRKK